ncbi:MAG: response regulator [Treponema sp.]|nr:response regulator [Treponema sp.]
MAKKTKKSQIYSALEVANICGVVNQTAINWIKAGHLKAFTTPGGQFRVYPEDLIAFMAGRGMEIPEDLKKAAGQFKNNTVLIVDDDKTLNTVIAKYISKNHEELNVLQAFDGFEAGAITAKEKPSFVVLDLDLPGVDGFALCKRLKEDTSFGNPKIAIVTAIKEEGLEQKVKDLGADYFVEKPVNMEQLDSWVVEYMIN